jgi:hypothetical protein
VFPCVFVDTWLVDFKHYLSRVVEYRKTSWIKVLQLVRESVLRVTYFCN